MARTKELSEGCIRAVDTQPAGSGYKSILEEFGLHQDDSQIMYIYMSHENFVEPDKEKVVFFEEAVKNPFFNCVFYLFLD